MEKGRLYYVDWLRILVVLSLILYHSALTYTGIGDIYIKTPINDIRVLPFLIITAPLGSFFMTLLFFVSGMATYYSFQYRGKSGYIRERIRKVFIPLLLGTLILCPIQAYFKGLYEGFSGNIIQFIPEFFSKKIVYYLGYAHLWFLLYLFVFSLISLPLFSRWLNDKSKLSKLSLFQCRGNNIYIPIIFIIISEILLRPFFPGPQTLIMDWANDVVYLSSFIFGFVFASDINIQVRVSSLADISKVVFGVLAILYIIIEYLWLIKGSKVAYLGIIVVATKGLYECSAIIFLLWLGKKYFNKKSPLLSYISKASFTYYLIHFIPVSMFTYYFIRLDINVYIKYLLVVLLSYLFIFVAYEILVRRLLSFVRRKVGALNRAI